MQAAARLFVNKADVAKLEIATGQLQWAGAGAFRNFRRLIEQHEGAFEAGQPDLQIRRLPGEHLQRLIDLRDIRHDHEKGADRQGSGPYVAHPYVERCGSPGGNGESDGHVKKGLLNRKPYLLRHSYG